MHKQAIDHKLMHMNASVVLQGVDFSCPMLLQQCSEQLRPSGCNSNCMLRPVCFDMHQYP